MTVLSTVTSQIHRCAVAFNRQDTPQLMAVSKHQPAEKIKDLLTEGHRLFGENRVQEATKKWPDLKKQFPDATVHLIGPLQTNKVKEALAFFDGIQTIDRLQLAEKIAYEWHQAPRSLSFFIQVNVGEEPQKSGVLLKDFPLLFKKCCDLKLPISGLMAIPPNQQDPIPYFTILKTLSDQYKLPHLSMGMSGDFEQAISCGSTIVRLGTALFGERE